MTNKDKCKQAFGALHASGNINLEMKSKTMKKRNNFKVVRAVAAVAACAVLVFSGINYSGVFNKNNSFTMNVYAADLKEGSAVPVKIEGASNTWTIDNTFGKETFVTISFPMTIKGENIKSVDYALSKGCFQVNYVKGKSLVTGGEITEGLGRRVPHDKMIEEAKKTENWELDEDTYYKNFSLSYDKQAEDLFFVDILNSEVYDSAKLAPYWDKNASTAQKLDALNYVFDDIVVTCTVTFNNGDKAKKEIYFKAYGDKYPSLYCYTGNAPEEYEEIVDTESHSGPAAESETASEVTSEVASEAETQKTLGDKNLVTDKDAKTQQGDRVVVREEIVENSAELYGDDAKNSQVVERNELLIDVTEPQFAQWDWEPTEEDIMPNVQEAIGHKVGESFTISFEYGDCRVYHTYTILEIYR